jgi:hypothetical protein
MTSTTQQPETAPAATAVAKPTKNANVGKRGLHVATTNPGRVSRPARRRKPPNAQRRPTSGLAARPRRSSPC